MAWVAGIVVAVIVVGAGGYFGYRMFAGEGAKQKLAAAESAKTDEPTASAPAKDSTAPAGQDTSTGVTSTASSMEPPKGQPAAPASTGSPTGPVVMKSEQPASTKDAMKEPGATPKAKAPKAATTQPASATNGASAPTPAPSAPAKAPTKAPTTVAQASAAAQPDRWQMFADDIARCKKEDFLQRFVCEQRTRGRYCDGYWGKVPQCPSAPSTDHGQ
jgi:hypothetical protein